MSEALDRIAKAYEPGCCSYWENVKDSAWTSTFDQMEKAMLGDSDALVRRKIIWFEKTIMDLIAHFKKLRTAQRNAGME